MDGKSTVRPKGTNHEIKSNDKIRGADSVLLPRSMKNPAKLPHFCQIHKLWTIQRPFSLLKLSSPHLSRVYNEPLLRDGVRNPHHIYLS